MMKRQLFLFLSVLILVSLACQTVLPQRPTPTPPIKSPENEPTSTPKEITPSGEAVEASLEEAHPLDRYPPTAPLMVRFNQPMDPDSAHPAILSYPWVEVQESWDNTYTMLTAAPAVGFPADQSIQLFLNRDLRSALGTSLEYFPAWEIRTPDAPFVTAHIPGSSELKNRRPDMKVSFSREMDPTAVAAALRVQPQIKFELLWRDDHTLVINAQDALTPGTRYHFRLSETAADVEGIPLGSPYMWDYWLERWDVNVSFPPDGDEPGSVMRLNFTYPVDRQSVQDALYFEPAIGGLWSWSSDSQAELRFDQPLPLGKIYTLNLGEGAIDANGDPLPPIEHRQFITPPPILDYGPRDFYLVDREVEIWIQFDRPMDKSRTENAFHLKPEFPGEFSWRENALIFKPSAPLTMYTDYTVTLDSSAVDLQGGSILIEPFIWTFHLEPLSVDYNRYASFGDYGPNGQVLDADGRRAVQFVASPQLGQVTFELYRMTLEQFLDRYSSRFRGVAGREKVPISTQDTTLEASWEQPIASGGGGYEGNIFETFIPQEVPAGLYILNLVYDGGDEQLILVYTRNAIVVKQVEGQLFTWVSDINGGSVPDLSVSIYARDGVLVAQGQADENGIFRTEVSRDPQPLIVVAQDGEDITASGLSNEWSSPSGSWWGWWYPAPKAFDYTAFIYTDRPIYRPGQTVFFKAILRSDEDVAFSTIPPGSLVTVRIRDSRDNVVQTSELSSSEFGSVSGDFTIAEGAMLGSYAVEVQLDNESQRQQFKVQDYRKPDYQVTVSTDLEKYVTGDSVLVTVQASYFFGEPVANASITISQYNLWEYTDYWAEGGPVTQYVWGDYYTEPVQGVTDRDGVFTFSLPASYQADTNYYYRDSLQHSIYSVEATVDDGSHQTVSSYAVYRVYNAAERMTLDIGGYFKSPGESFTVRSSVSTLDGDPVGDRSLSLALRRWNPNSYDYDIVVQSERMATGADGNANLSFTIEQAGYYQMYLSATDSRGNPVSAVQYVYAFSEDTPWYSDFTTSLRVSADRDSYLPGEVAQVIIESKFSGVALLTFERGKVHRERIIQLESPFTQIEVPILASDAPNIFVTVNAYQVQENQLEDSTYFSFQDSQLQMASVNLEVPVTGKQLDISITPDRTSYTPRDEATFTVRVTDETGQPVSAEVSVGIVDEAIYSLSEELTRPMFEVFYGKRDNLVRTYDSMALRRELLVAGRGGGGGDGLTSGPRTQFPDTAGWFPALFTDSNGEVQVTVPLPDSLTSWRVTARAVTVDTQVGENHINVLTHQAIVVRPILPRSLTSGDLVVLTSMVHNYSDQEQQVSVSIEDLGGLLSVEDPGVQTIILSPGEVEAVGWSARALQAGTSQVVVSADPLQSESGGDSVLLTLPIQPLAVPEVNSQSGAFTSEFITALFLPPDSLPMSGFHLELSPSIAGSLLQGLEYLTGYPYGCVEQTMSRALPNAVIGRAFNQLGVLNPTLEADLPNLISAGLQKLYGYQHNDGGWGWWFDDSTNDYQTAWVIFGLVVTSEAGFPVDQGVIQRGVDWLGENLDAMDIRTRAFALFSMALANGGDMQTAYDLYQNSLFELDTFSQAALALTLEDLGLHTEAAEIVGMLAESAARKETQYFWPQPNEDGHYYDKTMASTIRSTAMALQAFVTVNPDHAMIPGIVQYLMAQRKLTGWGSTNETAFTILALTGYLLNTQLAFAGAEFEVELNGEQLDNGNLGGDMLMAAVDIPAERLEPGQNTLHVRQSGSERLYFTLTGRTYLAQEAISPDGNVQVERAYLDPQTDQPLDAITAGQLVRVQITVKMPLDGFFIILEDHLPGGFEALNESLNTTSHESTALGEEPHFFWQEYGYNNKEVHADRVSFFISELPVGEHIYSYLARATHSGDFAALPAELSAMYDVSLWGRSASTQAIIAE